MSRARYIVILLIASLIFLPACTPASQATDIPVILETPTLSIPPTASPTPVPAARALNVCLGGEPNTLYLYGNPNSPARSVLSAIYDGPIDLTDYDYEPVILEKIPSLDDGDAQLAPITVRSGDQIVDANGNLTTLKIGDRVRPSGCRSGDCVIAYDGVSQIQMDQLIVTFVMLEGLTWSDGEPLTAEDSVYSFQIASAKETPASKYLIDRTQTYEAASDGVTIQWWGKPGFTPSDYYVNFWTPLPQHLWGQFSSAELLTADTSTKTPLGWGPYILNEWKAGESLHFIRNLNYFRADSGLPIFDQLNFFFYPEPNAAITALVDGKCDLLDPSVRLDGQVGLLKQMQLDGQAKLTVAQSNTMEWLGIGIDPSSYDNGFNPFDKNDRPDFFGDARMRQALARCLDRQKIVDTVLFGLSQVPDGYLSSDHPLHNGNVQTYDFNVQAGATILEQIGWLDHDQDPATPRQSQNVVNIVDGTPLVLSYVTSSAAQRRQATEIVAQSLAECGIVLNIAHVPASELYLQGPDGALFGRRFDLAEYAVGVNTIEPQCGWFISSQIPTEKNNWIGVNISGYTNQKFDSACTIARQALPEDPAYTSHQEAQAIFAVDLPSIPLYHRLRIAATRPDFCGFALDPASTYPLASIESFDYGTACQ